MGNKTSKSGNKTKKKKKAIKYNDNNANESGSDIDDIDDGYIYSKQTKSSPICHKGAKQEASKQEEYKIDKLSKSDCNELKLIEKILKNILDHPQNPKYKDLNYIKIKQRLNNSSTYFRWLNNAGFEPSMDNQRFILNNMDKVKQVYSSLLVVMTAANKKNHKQHDIINMLNHSVHHSSKLLFDSECLLKSSLIPPIHVIWINVHR
eukprot:187801_1